MLDYNISASPDDSLGVQMSESQVILAYRYFTHAMITANYFMLIHNESSENLEGISKKFSPTKRKNSDVLEKKKIEEKKRKTLKVL